MSQNCCGFFMSIYKEATVQITFSFFKLAEHFPEIEKERINKVWYALQIINDLNTDRWDRWAKCHLPIE